MVFRANSVDFPIIPAVYCTDYYAEEIAAEKNGTSNSTFYTDTYSDSIALDNAPYKWICPNLTESTIFPGYLNNLKVELEACWIAKQVDLDFEPDLECSENSDVEQKQQMRYSQEYILYR